eukprot:TRINITY_DN5770_c0_g1_i2.p1 TRINITY_DN5770_c0_g1~~TRINITY_DN5770_c0_g1_i2.p1  ORF type:complete len:987 (+),score=231.36 TRINITY_DN5770_c0_g1_i2:435-2963(+)
MNSSRKSTAENNPQHSSHNIFSTINVMSPDRINSLHNNSGAFNNSSGVDMDDSDDDLDLNNDFDDTSVSPQPPPSTSTTNTTPLAGVSHILAATRQEQPQQTKSFSPMKAGKLFAAAMEKSSAAKAKKCSPHTVKNRSSGDKTKTPSQPFQRAGDVGEPSGQDKGKRAASEAVIPVAPPEIVVEEGGKQSVYFNPNPSRVRRAHPNKVPSTLSQLQIPSSSSSSGGASSAPMDSKPKGGGTKPSGVKESNHVNGEGNERKKKGIAVPPPASYDPQPRKSQNNGVKKIVNKDEIITKGQTVAPSGVSSARAKLLSQGMAIETPKSVGLKLTEAQKAEAKKRMVGRAPPGVATRPSVDGFRSSEPIAKSSTNTGPNGAKIGTASGKLPHERSKPKVATEEILPGRRKTQPARLRVQSRLPSAELNGNVSEPQTEQKKDHKSNSVDTVIKKTNTSLFSPSTDHFFNNTLVTPLSPIDKLQPRLPVKSSNGGGAPPPPSSQNSDSNRPNNRVGSSLSNQLVLSDDDSSSSSSGDEEKAQELMASKSISVTGPKPPVKVVDKRPSVGLSSDDEEQLSPGKRKHNRSRVIDSDSSDEDEANKKMRQTVDKAAAAASSLPRKSAGLSDSDSSNDEEGRDLLAQKVAVSDKNPAVSKKAGLDSDSSSDEEVSNVEDLIANKMKSLESSPDNERTSTTDAKQNCDDQSKNSQKSKSLFDEASGDEMDSTAKSNNTQPRDNLESLRSSLDEDLDLSDDSDDEVIGNNVAATNDPDTLKYTETSCIKSSDLLGIKDQDSPTAPETEVESCQMKVNASSVESRKGINGQALNETSVKLDQTLNETSVQTRPNIE